MCLVSIVSYNSAEYLAACLDAVLAQRPAVRIKVFDNASRDASVEIAQNKGVPTTVSDRNLGFAAAHNRNLMEEDYRFALILNPDCVIAPDFVRRLIGALEEVPGAGMAGGKLWRMNRDGRPLVRGGSRILDSTGIYFTPSQRHFDRGSSQPDRGQYERRQLVFGVSGAAMLVRRSMLEDIRFEDEYFDEDFFCYREDAELCWRAQMLGWSAVYEPRATALHRRHVLPERRKSIEASLNRHSLKNRFLMRRKNMDLWVRLRCFPFAWLRDVGILAYVLLRERSSWGAYSDVRRLKSRFEHKRRAVRLARRVPAREIAGW